MGKEVIHTCYVDANLMHDITTGKSVSATLHLLNQTPVEWFSKKQRTVETATYGSKFVATRTAVDQIVELRNILRYLGVPLVKSTDLFGDNQSVVDSVSIPHYSLHIWYLILSFHHVQEAVAAEIIKFHYLPGRLNPSDTLSKLWGYQKVKDRLKALLFWEGDTLYCNNVLPVREENHMSDEE